MYVKNPKRKYQRTEKEFTAEIPKYQRDDAACKKKERWTLVFAGIYLIYRNIMKKALFLYISVNP